MEPVRARALIGWMTEEDALLALAGRRQQEAGAPELEEVVRQKRLVASARRPAFGTQGVFSQLPGSLQRYAAELEQTREGAALVAAGSRPALIDLRRVCAIAPQARANVALPDVDADDLEGLAAITLRAARKGRVEAGYDEQLRAWIVTTAEPDLHVLGQFNRPGRPEFVVGLILGHSAPFLQAVRADDRFVLTAGYDQAVSLLARGIHVVPAFVRSYGGAKNVPFGSGTIERDLVLGRRPPLLPDFLDDDVSAEVAVPPLARVLMVRAVEITHHGADS